MHSPRTEARAAIQRALELEPLSLTVLATSGLVWYYQHEYGPAITEYRKALGFQPGDDVEIAGVVFELT